MAGYRLTQAAEEDIHSISRYTLQQWNEEQARKYLEDLLKSIETVASMSGLGQRCPEIHQDYHRFLQGKHWIYYKADFEGILIVRILHHSMHQSSQSFE